MKMILISPIPHPHPRIAHPSPPPILCPSLWLWNLIIFLHWLSLNNGYMLIQIVGLNNQIKEEILIINKYEDSCSRRLTCHRNLLPQQLQ
jgi:hypothetical protein